MIPKIKQVRDIEDDLTKKCILINNEADRATIEEYSKSKGFELSDEKVTLTYDNLSMSKF